MREEHVGALYGLAVVVDFHVEGLDVLWIVGHDDRPLEMLFDEEALVLCCEVHAPADGALKNRLESLDEGVVDAFVEEIEVILTVFERPSHAVLDEVLLEVHEFVEVDESHLGLNHPELGEMPRCVGVLSPEGGSEGIDGSELSADGQRGLFSEEIVVVDDFSFFILFQVIEVFGRHLEHLSSSLAVAASDDG